MADENKMSHNDASGQVKWIEPEYMSIMYIIIGFLLLIVAPYAMTIKSGIWNDNVMIVNTVFGIIVIILGVLSFMNNTDRRYVLKKAFPVLMLIAGIITIFLYSHFYDTKWDETYHLYIVNITDSGAFHIAYYKARDLISEMSSIGGVVIVLGALYEILYRRMVNP
jgi:hypothetical protein